MLWRQDYMYYQEGSWNAKGAANHIVAWASPPDVGVGVASDESNVMHEAMKGNAGMTSNVLTRKD